MLRKNTSSGTEEMARKKEFDEMTLITEESTINEPPNMAKKEEYLRELHR